MNNRNLKIMTGLLITAVVILMAINVAPIFWHSLPETYLSYNGVQGIAVEHNHKLYTLNFSQQNTMIELLNRSLPTNKKMAPDPDLKKSVEKIVIYPFGAPTFEITPIAYENNHLFFEAPKWNPDGQMLDVSNGDLEHLISETYD